MTLEQLNELLEQAHREEIAPRELLDPLLMPMDTAVEDLPEVNLIPELADMVQHGQPVQVLGAPELGALRLTMGEEHLFIGVGEMNDDGKIAPKRFSRFPRRRVISISLEKYRHLGRYFYIAPISKLPYNSRFSCRLNQRLAGTNINLLLLGENYVSECRN